MRLFKKSICLALAFVIALSVYVYSYKSAYTYKEYDKGMYVMDRNRITIGVYGYSSKYYDLMTEEHLKVLKDCGIDLIINTKNNDGFYELCSKYNVGIIANHLNATRYGAEKTPPEEIKGIDTFKDLAERYKDYDSLYGDDIFDEPNSRYFDLFNDIVNVYREQKPEKIPFFNLHPMNCPDYEYYLGTSTYDEYIRLYTNKVDTDYISFDIYPFDNAEVGLYSKYLENLDIVSTACRESGKDLWIIIQAGGWAKGLNKTQIGWQMYTSLAYGAVSLIHACYTPQWWAKGTSLIKLNGEKNPLWDIVKEKNEEIHALSDVYMKYKNLGVCTLGTSSNYSLRKQLYAQNERNDEKNFSLRQLKNFKNIKSDNALTIGCFKEKQGDGYAAMFVNSDDPYLVNETCNVTFRAKKNSEVAAYNKGEKTVLKPQDGIYSIDIEPGEGVFVTIS